ncbi:hypothetical protein MMC09_005609 [Bachmanniomyces sp. S44760]|nr:hypothetical protein [Bachmanniomyces sp. S44760]
MAFVQVSRESESTPSQRFIPRKRSRHELDTAESGHEHGQPCETYNTNAPEHTEPDSKKARGTERAIKTFHFASTVKLRPATNLTSSQSRRHASSATRPSKFIEGSMNDRVSKEPPSIYTREEQVMEQYHADREDNTREQSMDVDFDNDAGIEHTKPSGMYRFGRAIATAFNPVHVWHGINGFWKEKQEEDPEKIILRERQARAEKTYAELKNNGFQGTHGHLHTTYNRQSEDHPAPNVMMEDRSVPSVYMFQRDSGVAVDTYRTSIERKRDGVIFGHETSVPQSETFRFAHSISPASDAHESQKSSLRLSKPSFSGLKKVKSRLQLANGKIRSNASTPLPPSDVDLASAESEARQVTKQPSKRDFHKHDKLTRKVSNLESKLEQARLELQQISGDAPPVPRMPVKIGRKSFKPGGLPTLLSERRLNEHIKLDPEGTYDLQQGDDSSAALQDAKEVFGLRHDTFSTARPKTSRGLPKGVFASDSNPCLPGSLEKSGPKKRKNALVDDEFDIYRPDTEANDDAEWLSAENAAPKKRSPGSRKSRRVELGNLGQAVSGPQGGNLQGRAATEHGNKRTFNPDQIDKFKILGMRAEARSDLPFGHLSDDIINIQKIYPGIVEEDLVKYIKELFEINDEKEGPKARSNLDVHQNQKKSFSSSTSSKLNTDHTSLSHHDLAPRPTLGPPLSSPRKRKSTPSHHHQKQQSHSVSASASLPTSHAQTPKSHRLQADKDIDVDEHENEDSSPITISPAKNADVPAVPAIPKNLQGPRAKIVNLDARGNTNLFTNRNGKKDTNAKSNTFKDRDEQEESLGREKGAYAWPEDVF